MGERGHAGAGCHIALRSEGLRRYATLFDVAMSDADVEMLRTQFTGGLASLADLRAVDLDGIEPFVAFPIDRGQP